MNRTMNTYLDTLMLNLPERWHEPVRTLADELLQPSSPLKLTLAGGFSVGKSSLLNMLLGEPLLYTAKEEATALPTFLEYGPQRRMTLIGGDGSELPLEAEDFMRYTTQAPEGAACAVLAEPVEWLQGVSIIDLPGLGSLSARHREYAFAQIQQADAVLYLLEPRGPTPTDLDVLTVIHRYGKRVFMAVARWDEVEQSVARQEKAPDLKQWQAVIAEKTGVDVTLQPVSYLGAGKSEVLAFLANAKAELSQIRFKRFKAELQPVIENALGVNAEEQRVCSEQSEENARHLHAELVQRKQQLLAYKTDLYQRQKDDRETVAMKAEAAVKAGAKPLVSSMQTLAEGVEKESQWEDFEVAGANRVNAALAQLANEMSALSVAYGKLDLPDVAVSDLNLRIPAPQVVDVGDFLEVAKLQQLQRQLVAHEAEFEAKEKQLAVIPETDLTEEERALRELMHRRHELVSEPLPMVVRRVEGNGMAAFGRLLGEAADIALFFVNPATAGAKVASLLGKGAKVATAVSTGIKVSKAAQMGKAYKKVPGPVMEKLGALEVLSLGYWGEKLGSMMGGAPYEELVVDQEAQAMQMSAMAELDAAMARLRHDLQRKEQLASQQNLTGWALEQNKQEQTRIQSEIQELQQRAEQRVREARLALENEHRETVKRYAVRAVRQWLSMYELQAEGMAALLRERVRAYWEGHVEEMVTERAAEVEALLLRVQAEPREKAERLAVLQVEAGALAKALVCLA